MKQLQLINSESPLLLTKFIQQLKAELGLNEF